MPKFARPNSYNGRQSNKNWTGQVRAANSVEVAAGVSEQLYISPKALATAIATLIPDASQTVKGIIEIATDAENVTGTDATRATTPAGLTARLAAPGTIGGTTPAAITGTTVTANTQLQVNGGAVTDSIGTATLVAGTVTVLNTNISAADRIIAFQIAPNASTAIGVLSYTISAGVSFTVNSLDVSDASVQTGDLSTIGYLIVREV